LAVKLNDFFILFFFYLTVRHINQHSAVVSNLVIPITEVT